MSKRGTGGRPAANRGSGSRGSGRGSSGPKRGSGSSKRSSAPRKGPARGSASRDRFDRGSADRGSASRGDGENQARSGQNRGGRGGAKKKIRGLGGDHVEGRQAVRELLLAGKRRVREVVMIDDLDPAEILEDITELAIEMKVTLRVISRRRFETEALTQSSQGVLARTQAMPEESLDDLMDRSDAFLLVLDGLTDPGNLGSLLRTAECAGVTGVVLPRHRAVHITPTVTKNAAGAIEHLPMALVGGIPTAITQLKDAGVLTVGLDAGGDASLFDLPLGDGRPVALVLGAEGAGLSRLARERVDTVAAIPLAGQLNSLNVAIAGGIACFEVVRCRQGSE